jgi:hypothetical protein
MQTKHFRALLDLMLCCDPWPTTPNTEENQALVVELANEEAVARGFTDWIDACHNLKEDKRTYTEAESSNTREISFNAADNTMDVTFRNGGHYRYFDVPADVYQNAIAAESIGSFMAKQIKGKYRYAHVNGD